MIDEVCDRGLLRTQMKKNTIEEDPQMKKNQERRNILLKKKPQMKKKTQMKKNTQVKIKLYREKL